MKTSPPSAASSPAITRRSVDLPLPLGPSSAVSDPLSTLIETSSSATNSPNFFVTLRASIATEHRHSEEGQDRERPEQHRGAVRAGLVEVLVGRLHVLGQRLRATRDSARHDRDCAELA